MRILRFSAILIGNRSLGSVSFCIILYMDRLHLNLRNIRNSNKMYGYEREGYD